MIERISRRSLLRSTGAGVGLSLLGLSRVRRAEAQAQLPKRLILVFSPNGTIPWEWEPEGTPDNYRFRQILEPLTPLKDELSIFQGIDQRSARSGPGDGHQTGIGHLWTGRELLPGNTKGGCRSCDGVSWAGGPSIDQVVADTIAAGAPYRSVELGANSSDRGADVWTRMIYRRASEPLPPIDDPRVAFERLFGSGFSSEGATPQEVQRAMLRRSVLDVVKRDFESLAAQVGQESRSELDRHLTMVREVEQQIFTVPEEMACTPPDAPDSSNDFPEVVAQQIRLGVAALACDLTRVLSLQWNRSFGNQSFRWIGVNGGHHSLSHRGDSDQGAVSDLVAINRWYAERFRDLITQLAAVPEGDGSLLDNTLVVWGNELGKGNNHTRNNIPFVLAGGRNGLMRPGRWLRYQNQSHTDFLAAIGRAFGAETATFGDPRFSDGRFDDL